MTGTSFATTMKDWQGLVGAIVGGIFALFVALLVARKARMAEERTAAMLLIVDLQRLISATRMVERLIADRGIPEQDHAEFLVDRFMKLSPALSAAFSESVARLMNVDIPLSCHLAITRSMVDNAAPAMIRLEQDYEFLRCGKNTTRLSESVHEDMDMVHMQYFELVDHAECAVYLLGNFVLAKHPIWHRFRRRFSPTDKDRRSASLLEFGSKALNNGATH